MAPKPLGLDDAAMRIELLTDQLRQAGLMDLDTPASMRSTRDASVPSNPLMDGFAPMIRSVPQADR
jgi:hypothetical protein